MRNAPAPELQIDTHVSSAVFSDYLKYRGHDPCVNRMYYELPTSKNISTCPEWLLTTSYVHDDDWTKAV